MHAFRLPATALLAAAACAAQAAEYGLVLSSAPVTASVAVPQTACHEEWQPAAPANSGGGALLGAVIGGLAGSAIGSGSGRAAATGLGLLGGAIFGERQEARQAPPGLQPLRRCHTEYREEQRLIGYDVVYEYQGQRHSARVAQDPGSRIPLQVSVAPAVAVVTEPARPAWHPPAPVAAAPPEVPYYSYGGAFHGPPVTVVPHLTIGGHWHRNRHGRYR